MKPVPSAPLASLRRELHNLADAARAKASSRYFKTGPGEYGEGDRFLGIQVPRLRVLARRNTDLPESDLLTLLRSPWHEERLLALLILVRNFDKARNDDKTRARICRIYLGNTKWINNWDLVDTSAPHILGAWLVPRDRNILDKLAASNDLWEQRIAVLATLAFIRKNDFHDTLRLCASLLTHNHDLMHKAMGWMLREIGKRDTSLLRHFLHLHLARMPRTMLRYAIEKFPPKERLTLLSHSRSAGLPSAIDDR